MAWFPVSGTGGGGGFTLGPVQNVFTGADRAAAESARDTYFTANPSNLAQYNADTSLNIRLEYADSGDQIALYQVRNSAGDAWLDNQSFRGVRGAPGADGQQGSSFDFESVTARDTLFTAMPNLLVNGLPINVSMGGNTITVQVWTGADNPASYDPATDDVFWQPASLRTSTGSLELGAIHTVSSGGENVFFDNMVSNIAYFPPWSAVGDHSNAGTRTVSARPLTRTYGDFGQVDLRGSVASTGAVAYDVLDTLTESVSVFGISFVLAETYNGQIVYEVDESTNNIVAFEHIDNINGSDGDTITIWFAYPVEGRSGQGLRGRLFKSDRTILQVRPVDGGTDPYVQIARRTFTDVPLALSTDVPSLRSASETVALLETLTGNERLDASAIQNLPSGADGVVTNASASLNPSNVLTITLNRSNGLADVVATVDLSSLAGGGTPPTPVATDLRYGLSNQSDPALVDFNALTDEPNPTDPITISTGTTTAGQYFHIFSTNTHEIQTITDTVLSQIVYQSGGTGNIFTLTSDARTVGGATFDAYSIGPLNAGVDEEYVIAFS